MRWDDETMCRLDVNSGRCHCRYFEIYRRDYLTTKGRVWKDS